jgi:7-cyano-7-deazaguanine synthase
MLDATSSRIGVLASGGLDSCILVGHLLEQGHSVQPFYIRSGLFWETAEHRALERFLIAIATRELDPLVTLQLPLADLYGEHWSITGRDVPNAESPDDAVFLPGRNALLVIKAALWCQLRGIGQLALGTLGSNPFPDATSSFFADIESALNRAVPVPVRLLRPFDGLDKRQVMELGRRLPLERTLSCIDPVGGRHCGKCNKCAERKAAFRLIAAADPTDYAAGRSEAAR